MQALRLVEAAGLGHAQIGAEAHGICGVGVGGQGDGHFPGVAVLLGVLLLAVEGLQVTALQLADGGIHGVAAGAGIVEGPLGHLVHSRQELGLPLLGALFGMGLQQPIQNGLGDVDVLIQLPAGFDPVLEGLLVSLALDADQLAQLHVPLKGLRILVLGEGAHLVGMTLGVEAADVGEQQGVGGAVRNVEPAAYLVGQGMVDAQEGIGESDTGDGGGVGHLLTGHGVSLGIPEGGTIGPGQVVEHHLGGVAAHAVGVLGGVGGDIGFHRVGQHVIAGGLGGSGGQFHHVVSVDDGHFGHHLIVDQGPLHAGVAIGNDGEGGAFGAGTGGGGDADQLGLLAHLGEEADTLPDVQEGGGHVQEALFGILVHDPHDLGGVDGGAAAHGDDDVGLELVHLGQALHGVLDLGIHTDVEELGGLNAHVTQLVDDGIAGAQLIQGGVGDDEGTLEVVDLLHLPQGHGGAAGLVIDLLGQLEPQHVLLADGDVLYTFLLHF